MSGTSQSARASRPWTLRLHYTGVNGDIAPLAALTGLTFLQLDFTGVSGDVAPLAACTWLTTLSLANTGVTGSTALILAATLAVGENFISLTSPLHPY